MCNIRGLRLAALAATMLSAVVAISAAASAQALERIKQSGTLKLGYIDGVAPFSTTTGDKPSGYSIELCQKIADHLKETLGLSALTLQFEPMKAEDVAGQIAAGKADLLCTAVSDTLERRAILSFSIPVFNGGVGVLVRQDADEALLNVLNGRVAMTGPKWRASINGGLAKKTLAVFGGSASEVWVRQQIQHLGIVATMVRVDDYAAGVQLVSSGEADALFGERSLLQDLASKSGAGDLMVVDRIYTYQPLALAMGRNDDDFRLAVDTALSRLYQTEDFLDLYTRTFGAPSDETKRLFKSYARY
jgi:polar amino acid transport system substrate-binding protein